MAIRVTSYILEGLNELTPPDGERSWQLRETHVMPETSRFPESVVAIWETVGIAAGTPSSQLVEPAGTWILQHGVRCQGEDPAWLLVDAQLGRIGWDGRPTGSEMGAAFRNAEDARAFAAAHGRAVG